MYTSKVNPIPAYYRQPSGIKPVEAQIHFCRDKQPEKTNLITATILAINTILPATLLAQPNNHTCINQICDPRTPTQTKNYLVLLENQLIGSYMEAFKEGLVPLQEKIVKVFKELPDHSIKERKLIIDIFQNINRAIESATKEILEPNSILDLRFSKPTEEQKEVALSLIKTLQEEMSRFKSISQEDRNNIEAIILQKIINDPTDPMMDKQSDYLYNFNIIDKNWALSESFYKDALEKYGDLVNNQSVCWGDDVFKQLKSYYLEFNYLSNKEKSQ